MSLSTGVFPMDWKCSKLLPIYKSGAQDNIEHYRPISVIPAISKVIEKIAHRQLSSYLEESNVLSDCQFGFRHKRSTELAATLFVDNVKRKVNEGKLVGAIFIDLSKAFDTLSHAKLITKLQSYGIHGIELDWFQDYLFNRSQRVQYENSLSTEQKVTGGVPQGSIIGPLLFILFYNDFPSCLKHSKAVIYADDTVIYVPGKDAYIIESRLSSDMQRIMEWCLDNELILNFSKGKTEAMMFGTSKNLSTQPKSLNVITFGYQEIKFTTSYKYLGVEIDPSLNMKSNFHRTYKKSQR